ncbi:GNAT family N-acetyltransferase [Ornithinibacillus salinisoli]|uniref:GNAT family N-acetyltransferase n=1 Tax=Ornithinibacillus salinisoli TaxID=1848459 RepID=A0ABW4VZ70_9BACI
MKFIEWNFDRIEDLVNLWNKEIGKDFPLRKELFKQNSFNDVNVFHDGSLIAIDHENNVSGFIVTKKWQDNIEVGISKETGWIQVLLVDQKYRNQGIGKRLLQHAESKLMESGIERIWLGKDTWHYFPGIPIQYKETATWFEKQGYNICGEEFDLDCHYEMEKSLSIPTKNDVIVSLLDEDEKEEFLDFMHRCFPGRWEYEAIQYFQLGGNGREFVVLKKNERIIGFCRINDSNSPVIAQNVYWDPLYDGELGGIGPLGIDAKERKYGYGIFIVESAIAYLRKRNINSILIDWTGLIAFYNKLGYEVCKSYYSYQKNLVKGCNT